MTQPSQEERLKAALTDVFALMDEGFLVRNIANDHESDWAIKTVRYMKRLSDAHRALEPAPQQG